MMSPPWKKEGKRYGEPSLKKGGKSDDGPCLTKGREKFARTFGRAS